MFRRNQDGKLVELSLKQREQHCLYLYDKYGKRMPFQEPLPQMPQQGAKLKQTPTFGS